MSVAVIMAKVEVVVHVRIVYGPFIITGISMQVTCHIANTLLTSADIIDYSLHCSEHLRGGSIFQCDSTSNIFHKVNIIRDYLRFAHLVNDRWRIIHDTGLDEMLGQLIADVDEFMW